MIYNLLLMNTTNVGDKLASPLDYFEWPMPFAKICCTTWEGRYEESLNDADLVIYGGGGLIHLPSPDYNNGRMAYLDPICEIRAPKITWGVGHNIHQLQGVENIKYPQNFIDSFQLHGVRDINQNRLPWVPCASCMYDTIYSKYTIKREIICTGHSLKTYRSLDGFDQIRITDIRPDEVIRAIGESEYVITNSYHSAYWGLLMNRRVVVFDPLSSKFYGLPNEAVLSTPDNWKADMQTAVPCSGFAETCRERSRWYYEKIRHLYES